MSDMLLVNRERLTGDCILTIVTGERDPLRLRLTPDEAGQLLEELLLVTPQGTARLTQHRALNRELAELRDMTEGPDSLDKVTRRSIVAFVRRLIESDREPFMPLEALASAIERKLDTAPPDENAEWSLQATRPDVADTLPPPPEEP
jgi:hypothetical protein